MPFRELPVLPQSEIITSYYLRLRVEDKPGVLADITRILADQQISIDAMFQREPAEGEDQTDIIMLTHQTREKNVDAAIAKINGLPVVTGKVTRLRTWKPCCSFEGRRVDTPTWSAP